MREINEKRTAEQARQLLGQYRMLINIAGSQAKTAEGETAGKTVTAIDNALAAMNNPLYQDVLVVRYQQGKPHDAAAKTVGLAPRTFDRYQQRALLEFATLYSGKSLIVWGD